MSAFASYAFNKPHAAAYAMVVYQTAYLKCFYPREYMAALLTSVLEQRQGGRLHRGMRAAGHPGAAPLGQREHRRLHRRRESTIRFGLLAVKNLGGGFIAELTREREENGPYRSFYTFCKRLSPCREFNRRGLDSLIRCGALDGLGANRRQMLEIADRVIDQLDDQNRRNLDGQMGFFDTPGLEGNDEIPLPDVPELPYAELLAMEKEVAGLYLSGHPLAPYAPLYKTLRAARIDRILTSLEEGSGGYADGAQVQLLGMIGAVRTQTTKNGGVMAYVQFEDLYGAMELLVFPQTLSQLRPAGAGGDRGAGAGPAERPGRGGTQAPGRSVFRGCPIRRPAPPARPENPRAAAAPPPSAPKPRSSRHGLYLRLPSKDCPAYKRAENLLAIFEGEEPVYIRFTDTGKLVRAPRSLWIWPNAPLLEELCRVLGEENVALVD